MGKNGVESPAVAIVIVVIIKAITMEGAMTP